MRVKTLLTFTVVACFAAADLSREAAMEVRAKLTGEREFGEPHAEAMVSRYGNDVVPVLLQLLSEQDIGANSKGRVLFCLGKSRDPRAVQPMIDFVRDLARGQVDQDNMGMIQDAAISLGFTGDKNALTFLAKMAGKDFWAKCDIQPREQGPQSTRDGFVAQLRSHALAGIALIATPEALATLENLKNGAANDISRKVELFIRECKERISGEFYTRRRPVP